MPAFAEEAGDSGRLDQLPPGSTLLLLDAHDLLPDSTRSVYQKDKLVGRGEKFDPAEPWVVIHLKKKSGPGHPTLMAGRIELTPQKSARDGRLVLKVVGDESPVESIEVRWAKRSLLPNHLLTVAALHGLLYRGKLPASETTKPAAIVDSPVVKVVPITQVPGNGSAPGSQPAVEPAKVEAK